MPEPNFVFVYGTLKRGGRLHRNMEDIRAEFVCDATIAAKMYNLGWYPGITEYSANPGDGAGFVRGEIFLVREWAGIERLDCVEGHPRLFERRLVEAYTDHGKFEAKVWAYFYQQEVNPADVVAGGVWQVEQQQQADARGVL